MPRLRCGTVDEGVLDHAQQARLVAIDRQQIVAALRDDALGNRPLAAHGVDTHQIATEVQRRIGRAEQVLAVDGDLPTQRRSAASNCLGSIKRKMRRKLSCEGTPLGSTRKRRSHGSLTAAHSARGGHLLQRAHQIESIRCADFVRPKGGSGRDSGRGHKRCVQLHECERQYGRHVLTGISRSVDDVRVRRSCG